MLEEDDVERMSKYFGISQEKFVAEYLKQDEDYGGLIFKTSPCPFLTDNLCYCYQTRPYDCATYPHLLKAGFTGRLANMVANTSVCPILFNVFERLKEEMRPRGWNPHTYGRGGR